MANYYAYISGPANIITDFRPFRAYWDEGTNSYLRIEYVGSITTTNTTDVYVWRQQTSSQWFSFEQGTFQQYLNLGSTTYVTDVNNTSANRRKFNSTDTKNPAVFELNNGVVSLTFDNWTTTGTFSSTLPGNVIVFFPLGYTSNLRMYFYEMKVYTAIDTLLFDFVPYLSGSTKGMLDKVSGSFTAATNQSYMTLYPLTTFETDIKDIDAAYDRTTCAVTLTTDEETEWTASTQNDWITISPNQGTGSSVFVVTIAKNNTYASRTGLITIANNDGDEIEIDVTQGKYPLLVPKNNIYRADLEVVKSCRSGSTINKAYRSGELIYLRLNAETSPQPVTEPMLIHNGSPVEGDTTTPATVMVAETDTYVLFDVVVEDNTPWAIGYGFSKIAMGTGSTTGVQAMVLPTNPEFMTTTFGLMYKKDGDGDDSMSWTGFSSVFRFKLE